MIRASQVLRIVPQAHAMIPQHCKIRGHLYRPSRLNFYCRYASTTRHQRNMFEEAMFQTSLNSDVAVTWIVILTFLWSGLLVGLCSSSYSLNSQKNRQFQGALNTSERFQRNADMERIFENHTSMVSNYAKTRGVPMRDMAMPTGYYLPE